MSSERVNIHYQEASLDAVVRFYVKGFDPATIIEEHEYFIDAAKGKIILKLYVRAARHEEP